MYNNTDPVFMIPRIIKDTVLIALGDNTYINLDRPWVVILLSSIATRSERKSEIMQINGKGRRDWWGAHTHALNFLDSKEK